MSSIRSSRRWRIDGTVLGLVTGLFLALAPARGQEAVPEWSVDELLKRASESAEGLRAVEVSEEALDAEIAARDRDLAPRLTSELAYVQDQRRTFNPGRRSNSTSLGVTLLQPFSTGTSVQLSTGYEQANVASVGTRHIANWELQLSQALWRNGLGRATGLRRGFDAAERASRRWELALQRQRLLVALEGAYWDLALALKEMKIREENLARGKELASWVRGRIRRSAAEPTDSYQAEALVASRELDLVTARNQLESTRNRLRQALPGPVGAGWNPELKSLERERAAPSLLAPGQAPGTGRPSRLDALAGQSRSEQAKAQAQQVGDTLRPQLDLVVTHGRNGIQGSFGESWREAVGPDSHYTRVGLQLSLDLDFGLQGRRRQSAAMTARARELEAALLTRESEVSWEDLQRRIGILNRSVVAAKEVAASQERKSREERKRYRQGRTTAFQAISFEVEAANAELDVFRLLAELRKTESQARLFTVAEEKR